ncbi:uncharacterized protein LOC135500677 [Lineus longissimus]|uniref:uncharacterized protein LOC135500677 n=1 Tax=Lineus longissimus TaxID=88925 RepID=UPI00315CD4EA
MSRILRNDNSNQVITVIGNIAESLLNNPDIVKCIRDEEGHCFSNCVDQILQNLDIQHPVGSLLQATARAHHATYSSCSKTLLSMIYYWNRSAETLLDQGVPVEEITRYFQQGVRLCIDELDSIAIQIEAAPSFVSREYRHRQQAKAECHKSRSSHPDPVCNLANLTMFQRQENDRILRSTERTQSNVEEPSNHALSKSKEIGSSNASIFLGNQVNPFGYDTTQCVAMCPIENKFAKAQNCESILKTDHDSDRPETDVWRQSGLSDRSVLGDGTNEGYSSSMKEAALSFCLDGLDCDGALPIMCGDAGDFLHLSPNRCDIAQTDSKTSGDLNSVELQNIRDQDSGVGVNDSDDVSWYFDSATEADGSIIDNDFYAAMANISRVFSTIGGGLNGSRATMEAMFPISRAPVRGQGQNGFQIGQGESGVQLEGHGHSVIPAGDQGHNDANVRSSNQIDVVSHNHSLNSKVKGEGQCDIEMSGQGQNDVKGQTGDEINFNDCAGEENSATANDDMSWYFDQSEMPISRPSMAASSGIDSICQEDQIPTFQPSETKRPSQTGLTSPYSSLKENCHDVDFEDCFAQVEESKILLSGVKTDDDDDDDDDEFGACFEGVKFLERATEDNRRTCAARDSNTGANNLNVAKADDIDEEFDACFEGVKFFDRATKAETRTDANFLSKKYANDSNVNNEVDVCLGSIKTSVCPTCPGVFTTEDCASAGLCSFGKNNWQQNFDSSVMIENRELKDVDSSKSSFETLLGAKIKEKNSGFRNRIQNSCRHFKTFETSIQEMERNTNVSESTSDSVTELSKTEFEKSQSELLESQDESVKSQNATFGTKFDAEAVDFENVLAGKLAEKKKSFEKSVRNSCRHFKSFETSVQSMNKSLSSVQELEKSARGNLASTGESLASDVLQIMDSDDVSWYFDSAQGPRKNAENIECFQTSAVKSNQHLSKSKAFNKSCAESKTVRKTDSIEEDFQISSPGNREIRPQDWSTGLMEENCKKGLSVEKIGEKGLNVEKIGEKGLSVEKIGEKGLKVEKIGEKGLSVEKYRCCQEVNEILDSLCEGLGHGDPIGMGLAVEVYRRQLDQEVSEAERFPRFDLNKVHTCHVPSIGLKDPAIVSGFGLEVDVLQLTALQKQARHWVIMINGDLTPSSRHQGYNARQKTSQVAESGQESGDTWLTKTLSIIQKLNINTILVKGSSNPDLLSICLSRDIAILDHTPYKILHAISMATNTEPLSYITDATKVNVTSEVTVRPYRDDWMCCLSSRAYVCIELPLPIQTVMFCHPCKAVGILREESFWHCANRLANTVSSNRVLPGSGETEKLVLKLLENGQDTSYRSAIFEGIALGFRDYVEKVASNSYNIFVQAGISHEDVSRDIRNPSQEVNQEITEVMQNSVQTFTDSSSKDVPNCVTLSDTSDTPVKMSKYFDANSCNQSVLSHRGTEQLDLDVLGNHTRLVFDDYLAKREAWQTAADFVCGILQTDMYVVTGLGDSESRARHSVLGLL